MTVGVTNYYSFSSSYINNGNGNIKSKKSIYINDNGIVDHCCKLSEIKDDNEHIIKSCGNQDLFTKRYPNIENILSYFNKSFLNDRLSIHQLFRNPLLNLLDFDTLMTDTSCSDNIGDTNTSDKICDDTNDVTQEKSNIPKVE